MERTFSGFPKELPDFLWGIALHNEKPWFEARRDVYERVLHGPVKALAEDLASAMTKRHEGVVLRTHVSRIYRDARTLNGRGPLNDHMWFSLGRTARVYEPEPQFYFGIEARSFDWGMGFWNADTAWMERWRSFLDEHPVTVRRIVKTVREDAGCELLGGSFRKPKGDPGPALYEWYNVRRVVLGSQAWFDPDPPGPELTEKLLHSYEALLPLYELLGKI